ncbi:MurR/RpiR family transcriptional regulator [Erysipelothrix inopinata]|uniref:MurR/RpiR family transcriptional regulator n=1 Tax=Erysipelothrix inopinata TaxID=225084 RepID=A0A7G9RYU3_9FIRM|nr:MurR/RpiR family transcriptional regulator [Erysipelothrix inopinata]QNN60768.1 MurR/RpiR family transcriptional regulator [Erysipelothrix inopinata]
MKIETIVQEHFESLSNVDLSIWKFISNNLEKTTMLSISELAQLCNTSRTSVLRFSQKLGFSGYGELKLIIRQGLQIETPTTSVDLRANMMSDSILDFIREDYSLLFERLSVANRVFIYSDKHTETLVAQYFKRLFFSEDILVYPIWGEHEIRKLSENATQDDLIIFLAMNQDDVILDVLPSFIKRQVFTVNISKQGETIMHKLSDFTISISAEDTKGISVLFVMVELLHSMYQDFMKGGYHDEY